jgi:hypothetical protein
MVVGALRIPSEQNRQALVSEILRPVGGPAIAEYSRDPGHTVPRCGEETNFDDKAGQTWSGAQKVQCGRFRQHRAARTPILVEIDSGKTRKVIQRKGVVHMEELRNVMFVLLALGGFSIAGEVSTIKACVDTDVCARLMQLLLTTGVE